MSEKQKPDLVDKLLYHARMLLIAVVCGIGLFGALMMTLWILLSLGVLHIEDR
jgi:hypothetical protein